MFYCGIDIAKYKHEASVIDMSGKALSNSISFANDRQGCEKVLAIFEKGEYSATALFEDNIIALRQLSRYRLALVDTCGDCKRCVSLCLTRCFPSMTSCFQIHSARLLQSFCSTVLRLRICLRSPQESLRIFDRLSSQVQHNQRKNF